MIDRRTRQVYFDGYPDRQEILARDFEQVAEVDNEYSDSFILLRRR